MQTLTITTDNSDFLAKARDLISTLAISERVKVDFDDYPTYADNKSITEIVEQINTDIELYKQGKLETLTHEQVKAEIAKW
ncbi:MULTISPECIES: hypothetical protein [unclassified Campylobacter]|uniref:hypothetical protein n=1 Tax=unclassified Campylobacter TaxID=2593542 RepID=UPI003D33FC80